MSRILSHALVGAALGLCGTAVQADAFLGLQPWFKENRNTTTTIANDNEIVIPRLVFINRDSDLETAETLRYQYSVYEAGTDNLIGRTQIRAVSWPAPPCANPVVVSTDHDLKIIGDPARIRAHTLLNLVTQCVEDITFEEKTAYRTAVYSANVNNLSSWIKIYNHDAVGMNGLDFDSDGQNELLVVMDRGNNRLRVVFLNTSDGSVDSDVGIDADNNYLVESYLDRSGSP